MFELKGTDHFSYHDDLMNIIGLRALEMSSYAIPQELYIAVE